MTVAETESRYNTLANGVWLEPRIEAEWRSGFSEGVEPYWVV